MSCRKVADSGWALQRHEIKWFLGWKCDWMKKWLKNVSCGLRRFFRSPNRGDTGWHDDDLKLVVNTPGLRPRDVSISHQQRTSLSPLSHNGGTRCCQKRAMAPGITYVLLYGLSIFWSDSSRPDTGQIPENRIASQKRVYVRIKHILSYLLFEILQQNILERNLLLSTSQRYT